LFFEVLIAPDYTPEALAIITKKTTRIILKTNPNYKQETLQFKALLGGVIQQSTNLIEASDYTLVTTKPCNDSTLQDLKYAEIIVKHLKSNGISLVKNQQLIGMGCGQTSRIDALKSAIAKAEQFGFDLNGAAMASEAFFPFNDCVEIAAHHGIATIVQPGGSIKDQDSIDKANELGTTMYFSGIRHFKH
jgi:phosphoribosylaminoimidazolecarboxamide formyltransferase/IMP cyclohydrolase